MTPTRSEAPLRVGALTRQNKYTHCEFWTGALFPHSHPFLAGLFTPPPCMPQLLGLNNSADTPPREAHGFQRTVCGCALCQAPCHHIPGSLDVTDPIRLCPPGQDLLTWAEVHLRAVVDKGYPTLVPSRGQDGACHWLFEGRCAVHANAPFSCAFFDAHMTDEEIDKRSNSTTQARKEDAVAGGIYFQIWTWLVRKNLVVPSGNRVALTAEIQRLRSIMS